MDAMDHEELERRRRRGKVAADDEDDAALGFAKGPRKGASLKKVVMVMTFALALALALSTSTLCSGLRGCGLEQAIQVLVGEGDAGGAGATERGGELPR
jgi:hypothetical protein